MRRSLILAAALGALALAAGADPALAQTPIRLGDVVDGRITSNDPAGADDFWGRYRYVDYLIALDAGQRLEATMRSDAFDAFLALYRRGETHDAPLASDDDGLGEGTDARLRFTPGAAGDYILRARTLTGDSGGNYTLAVAERPAAAPVPRPKAARVGDVLAGALSGDSPEDDDGVAYDAYVLRLRAGERVSVRLESRDFDALLRIGRMAGGDVFEELAYNDDAPGGGLNAHLVFTAPAAGDYIVRATAFSASATGDYQLRVVEGPAPAPVGAIRLGQSVDGALRDDTERNDDGARAGAWRFSGQSGDRVSIEADSRDFDTYLTLFGERSGARDMLASDDDSGRVGTNSRILQTLPHTGDYVIEVTSFADAGSGRYTLRLNAAAPEPVPQPIAWGAVVQGEIGETDGEDQNGRRYDAYRFTGSEGQRIQAVMRSGDFDSFLQVGRAGDDFDALASDDDGLGEGFDSRLNFTLPEDGDYVLRVMPLGRESKGLYSLELIDRGPQPEPGGVLIGETARGSLSEADAITEEGVYYDAYRIQARAGDKLRLTMVSNVFDAFIEVGREEGGEFESLARDDDGLSDTHARLDWNVETDGVYVVRARTFAPGQTGDYVLTVERKP